MRREDACPALTRRLWVLGLAWDEGWRPGTRLHTAQRYQIGAVRPDLGSPHALYSYIHRRRGPKAAADLHLQKAVWEWG